MKTTSPSQFDIKKGTRVTGTSVRFGDALFLTCPRSYHDEAPYPMPGHTEWQELCDRAVWIKDAIDAYIAAGHELPN